MDVAEGEPGRGLKIALWVGTACVAGEASGLVAMVWNWVVQMVATGPTVLSWQEQTRWLYLSLPLSLAGGWWVGLKWAAATGFLREVSAWRRRWTVLGLLVGTVVAIWLLRTGMTASVRAWCNMWGSPDSVTATFWGVQESPEANDEVAEE